jgi:hypothetical protein
MMTKRFCALALITVILSAVTGCYFNQPLSEPKRNIDTWLLGVWEYKNDKGEVYRAGVVPKDYDHYLVWVRWTGKSGKEVKNYRFNTWISRVDRSYFLTMQCEESPGDIPHGAFVFLNYIVTSPNTVALRELHFDAPQTATSFELRAAVRARLKSRTLYADEGITVRKIGEIYRNPAYPNVLDLPLIPLRAAPMPSPSATPNTSMPGLVPSKNPNPRPAPGPF